MNKYNRNNFKNKLKIMKKELMIFSNKFQIKKKKQLN